MTLKLNKDVEIQSGGIVYVMEPDWIDHLHLETVPGKTTVQIQGQARLSHQQPGTSRHVNGDVEVDGDISAHEDIDVKAGIHPWQSVIFGTLEERIQAWADYEADRILKGCPSEKEPVGFLKMRSDDPTPNLVCLHCFFPIDRNTDRGKVKTLCQQCCDKGWSVDVKFTEPEPVKTPVEGVYTVKGEDGMTQIHVPVMLIGTSGLVKVVIDGTDVGHGPLTVVPEPDPVAEQLKSVDLMATKLSIVTALLQSDMKIGPEGDVVFECRPGEYPKGVASVWIDEEA